MENEIILRASQTTIVTADDMVEATEVLSLLNKQKDKIKAEKEKVLAPLRESAKAERDRWRPMEEQLQDAILSVRSAMSVYQTNLIKEKEKADAKSAEEVRKGKKDVGEAITDAINNTVEEKVEGQEGSVSFREKKELVIKNKRLIPKKYLIVDEKLILETLKEGRKVAGCELVISQVPINKR